MNDDLQQKKDDILSIVSGLQETFRDKKARTKAAEFLIRAAKRETGDTFLSLEPPVDIKDRALETMFIQLLKKSSVEDIESRLEDFSKLSKSALSEIFDEAATPADLEKIDPRELAEMAKGFRDALSPPTPMPLEIWKPRKKEGKNDGGNKRKPAAKGNRNAR